MPVYNAERYVAEAVESILRQTFRDFELIIINDGSTDQSLQILRQFAAADQRIQLTSRPNTGCVVALNEGLALARGEFVARMDADDISAPDRLEKQIAFLRSCPEFVLVGSRVWLVDSEGEELRGFVDALTHEEIDGRLMKGDASVLVHPACMIRRETMIRIGGYNESLDIAEDLDMYLKLAEVGRLANLSEVLLDYRQHPNSVSHKRRDAGYLRARQVTRDAHRRRGMPIPEWLSADKPQSPQELCDSLRWGWWALQGGNVRAARKHAWRAMACHPFKPASWRMMACAIRGH
jgi:glycosyltransferase involved in cell wall biosynthesis